jgi:hypothetical protein
MGIPRRLIDEIVVVAGNVHELPVFLASDDSAYITRHPLVLHGAQMAL